MQLVQISALSLFCIIVRTEQHGRDSINKIKLLISWLREQNRDEGFQTAAKCTDRRDRNIQIKETKTKLEDTRNYADHLMNYTNCIKIHITFNFSKFPCYSQLVLPSLDT